MSEDLDKLKGIRHLPIFPLPLVMLPNELLPLHIFEDRYRRMLADVLDAKTFFGLSFFETEEPLVDRPAAATVGCAVEVRESEMLPDGRSNIMTFGVARYRLLEYIDEGEPYLIAEIEFFEDAAEDEDKLNAISDDVFGLFERIAKAAFKISGGRGRFPEIARTTPEALSFLIAAAFDLENDLKYRLLETTSTSERLQKLHEILAKAVGQMEETADIKKASQTNGHSTKKLDI
jgi:Lon protease-like protein